MTGDWIIHGALIFGLVVAVPMTMALSDRLIGRSRVSPWMLVAVGVLASSSFFFEKGPLSAGLCNPWVITCVIIGLDKMGNPRTLVARLVYLLPHAYLVFGAVWLVVSRYGARPLDFPSVIVELTAVHFHFAGFVAPVIIALTRNHQARARGPLLVALVLSLAASPLTAIGFVYSAWIGALGAVTFMLGLFVWSVITVVVVVPRLEGSARWLMLVAAGSVLASMSLAAIYSVGVAVGEGWIEIPTMARTHGVLNAIGFSLCGAGAWLLATDREAPRPARGGISDAPSR